MLVSHRWLADYVPLSMSLSDLETRLMMSGLNHEETNDFGDDKVIDLEVTSNRPDCLGHLGVAREVSVLFDVPLQLPPTEPAESSTPVADLVGVEIECPELCYRFTARVIRGVKVGPSPDWLRERLEAIGQQSVNNIVDVTNYVMMECGQPLHAFNYQKLRDKKIIVREPKAGEQYEAIDHRTYKLEPGMCVIADGQRAVALGGVMGGADTEVDENTTDVLIEAARFSPVSIRGTARKLNLHSAASYRFERGVDPANVDWASRRCCELILQVAGGELASGVVDVGAANKPAEPVTLRLAQLPRVLGIDVPAEEARRILSALGCSEQSADDAHVTVIPPSWRSDLTREADLIEEVARIYGYEKIPEDVSVPMAASARRQTDNVLDAVRHVLSAAGIDEAMTISTVDEDLSEAYTPWSSDAPLATSTPVIGRASLLRRSLVPSLLAARRTNETLSNPRIELYEIAHVYLPGECELPDERTMLAITSGGDYFHLKGVLGAIARALGPACVLEYRALEDDFYNGNAAEIYLHDKQIGVLGEVSDSGLKKFELRTPASVAEIQLLPLMEQAASVRTYSKPPEYPAMKYDINLIVADDVQWDAIGRLALQHGGEIIEDVEFTEIYRDQKLADAGKKKVLFQVSFRSATGTLTHDEANAVHAKIVEACRKEFDAELG